MRRYPRQRAPFPRYHPPYPVPYANIPEARDYHVVAEPWRPVGHGFTAHSYPQQGIRTVRSPYIEDPYLNTAEDIRYNTIKPLMDPIPYTYGNERGSYNTGYDMNELEIDLLMTNAAEGSGNMMRSIGRPVPGQSSVIPKRRPRQSVVRPKRPSVTTRPFSTVSKPKTTVKPGAHVQAMIEKPIPTAEFILDKMDVILADKPPRTTTNFAQQAQQQQTALKPIMQEIPALQADRADEAVAQKEKSNAVLITAVTVPIVAALGFLGFKAYQARKDSGGTNYYDYY